MATDASTVQDDLSTTLSQEEEKPADTKVETDADQLNGSAEAELAEALDNAEAADTVVDEVGEVDDEENFEEEAEEPLEEEAEAGTEVLLEDEEEEDEFQEGADVEDESVALEETETGKDAEVDAEKSSPTKQEKDEEVDPEVNAEADKKIAKSFDPNNMPQVNASALAQRKWQIKVYPLVPQDFANGEVAKVFKQAKESLLYLYTAGTYGKYSNGKAELYVSSMGQAARVMQNLLKLDFYHPEANIKIIRKNDEGVVTEKAFMRYDPKMTAILSRSLHLNRNRIKPVGTKRDRVIGSVFLKNLPDDATKDMLRVMFPFAGEINFNPEKFKESTARLVLSNRNSVIPCLKAFSKVEMGGNILELRPLEKRNKFPDEDESPKKKEAAKAKQPSTPKSGESDKSKTPTGKDSVKSSDATKEKKAASSSSSKERGESEKRRDGKGPEHNLKRGGIATRGRPEQKRGRGSANYRSGLVKKFQTQRRFDSGVQSRYPGSSYSGRGGRGRGGLARSSARSSAMGMAGDVPGAEMSQEMIALQAQLSVAIKNQLSMLNQTQIAVEQAKLGAAAAIGAANQGQLNRTTGTPRRGDVDFGNRQRQQDNRNRGRDRRDSFENRGKANRGRGVGRKGSFGAGKRTSGRAGFGDSYEDASYPKRSNFVGSSPAVQASRSWADQSEELDPYRGKAASLSYGGAGYSGASFRGDTVADYGDDSAYGESYGSRLSNAGRSSFASSQYSTRGRAAQHYSNYDYGY